MYAGMGISFYPEGPDFCSFKSSSESGFSSESSSESDFSSWRITLNPNAEPGANADSISPSDWVVLISGFTFRFSWFSSKSVSYLPGYQTYTMTIFCQVLSELAFTFLINSSMVMLNISWRTNLVTRLLPSICSRMLLGIWRTATS